MKAKSIGCVVFREEKGRRLYLLLEASRINYRLGKHTFWAFTKGTPEKGENELQTALRETREETGIKDVEFIDGFRKTIRYFFKKGGKLINKEVAFYLAKTSDKKLKVSREHASAKWLAYEEALNKLTFKNSKSVLQAAEEFLEKGKKEAPGIHPGVSNTIKPYREIKCVIFDWNGVLTDSLKLDHEIFLIECKRKGVKAPTSRNFYANMFNENVFESFEKIGFHIAEEDEKFYKKLYLANLHRIGPFPGLQKMLSGMNGYTRAVITSNFANHVKKFFENHGIKGFDFIYGMETDRRKENKMKLLMEKLSIGPEEVIFVGDTVSDIVACRAAGVKIIAAAWGYQSRANLAKHKPDFIANKPADVIKILEKLENS